MVSCHPDDKTRRRAYGPCGLSFSVSPRMSLHEPLRIALCMSLSAGQDSVQLRASPGVCRCLQRSEGENSGEQRRQRTYTDSQRLIQPISQPSSQPLIHHASQDELQTNSKLKSGGGLNCGKV